MRGILCAALVVAASMVAPSVASGQVKDGQWVLIDGTGTLLTRNPPGDPNLADGERTIHTAPAGVRLDAPQWSPDGNRIVFVEGTRVLLYDVASGRVSEVAPIGTAPSWAPDSTRVAFVRDGALLTRALDGTDEKVLPIDATGVRDVAWSPRGDTFALWVGERIELVDADGSDRRPLSDAAHGGVAWAPYATSLVFPRMSPDIGRVELWQFTPSGAGAMIMGAAGYEAEFSPTGRAIVYTEPNGGVVVRDADSLLVPGLRNDLAPSQVDWQPCVPRVTVNCVSKTPPPAQPKLECGAPPPVITATRGRDISVPDFCPAAWHYELVEAPAHGVVTAGRRVSYRPAADYVGADTFTLRGVTFDGRVSDPVRVHVNLSAPVPRVKPAAPKLALATSALKLDKRGRVTVRGTCDRACVVTLRVRVKLTSGRVISGRAVRARAAAGGAVVVKLQRGKLPPRRKVAWARVSGELLGTDQRTRAVNLKLG